MTSSATGRLLGFTVIDAVMAAARDRIIQDEQAEITLDGVLKELAAELKIYFNTIQDESNAFRITLT